jgi:cyclophilin family peptidyl-prolyl cis-trans isomerase
MKNPKFSTSLGWGNKLYGHKPTAKGYIATEWVVAFYIPVYPKKSYEVLGESGSEGRKNYRLKTLPKLYLPQVILSGTIGWLVILFVLAALLSPFILKKSSPQTAAVAQPVQNSGATQNPEPTPVQPSSEQYSAAPPMSIDKSKQYTATVKMANGGEFVIQLYPDKAPITVNSFVFLARQGFFNGVTFHRVLEGFMAQGGDPTGTGMGGPGYQFANEDSDLKFDKPGVVAMANAGRDTNGSQFFITFVPTPQLDGGYTIFGQVVSGMEVVNGITRRDPNKNPSFPGDAIESITITEK